MSEFEKRNQSFGVGGDSDIEVERDVVIVESEKAPRVRRSPLAVLPLLLGVIFLLANLFVYLRVPYVFTVKNYNGAISSLLILASAAICVVLIVLGIAMRRDVVEISDDGPPWHLKGLIPALVLCFLAPLLTLWALQVTKSVTERANTATKPCIEVYEKAAAIAKDNPRFRMLDTDRDEVRCRVNAAIGR